MVIVTSFVPITMYAAYYSHKMETLNLNAHNKYMFASCD